MLIIFGVLIAIISLVLVVFYYQLSSLQSKDTLKSIDIINKFDSDDLTSDLTEMIDYHRENDTTKYKI